MDKEQTLREKIANPIPYGQPHIADQILSLITQELDKVKPTPTPDHKEVGMNSKVIPLLKEVSEKLDTEIESASRGLRTGEKDRCQKARMLIQEAITKLLENW